MLRVFLSWGEMLPYHHRCLVLMLAIALTVGGVEALAQDASAKLPVPDKRELEAALKDLRQTFSAELDEAEDHDSPDTGFSAAFRRLPKARELERDAPSQSDPTIRFAMLSLSAEWRTLAQDVDGAMTVIDAMAATYAIDPYEVKVKVLRAAGPPRPPCVQVLRRLVANAIAQRQWEAVETISAGTVAWAQETDKRTRWMSDLKRLQQEILETARAFRGLDATKEKLKRAPSDRAANLLVGRFHCFIANEWDIGLPHLAAGSDAKLAELARRDIASPVDAAEQVRLAEAWLAIGERENDIYDLTINARASHWLDHALPQLSGEPRESVEERLRELYFATSYGRHPSERIDKAPFQRLIAAIPKDLRGKSSQVDRQRLSNWLRANVTGQVFEAALPVSGKGGSGGSNAGRWISFSGARIVQDGVRYQISVQATTPDHKTARLVDDISMGDTLHVRGTVAACTVNHYGDFEADGPTCSITVELQSVHVTAAAN